MAWTNPTHARAAELAGEYLPEYMASWIAGVLRETHTLPALVHHQDRIAQDVLSIAVVQHEEPDDMCRLDECRAAPRCSSGAMSELTWTPFRHAMLREIAGSEPGEHYLAFHCTNRKRAIWQPVRLDLDLQFRLEPGDTRAVNDLWAAGLAETPDWQGDMDVLRTLAITDAGRARLAEWNAHAAAGSVGVPQSKENAGDLDV